MTTRLLKGGTVFDGTSLEPVQSDVLIHNQSIVEVGQRIPSHLASIVEDVSGLWVLPGFIDPHSHADAAVLTGENMELRMKSGVTTEIVGQDGYGLAYLDGLASEALKSLISPLAGKTEGLDFPNVGAYLDAVDVGAHCRVGMLSPHGCIRASVMGLEARPATSLEIEKMSAAFKSDLENGALGLSTALSYTPMIYSDASEVSTMLAAAEKNRRLVTHLREYGSGFESAILEVIDVAKKSKSHLHFSHFHVSGPGREDSAGVYLDLLSRFDGTLSIDSYPYVTSCTSVTALLPDNLKSLSFKGLVSHLQTRRGSSSEELDRLGPQGTIAIGWSHLVLKGLTGVHSLWNGRSISEVSKELGLSEGEVVIEAIVNEKESPMILVPQGHESNYLACASWSNQVVGSDGIFGAGAPHPRISESFTRFLAMARLGKLNLSVSDAVNRMTAKTARLFGLKLGEIKAGFPADIVMLDPQNLEVGSDFDFGSLRPIRETLISGVRCVTDGNWTTARIEKLSIRG